MVDPTTSTPSRFVTNTKKTLEYVLKTQTVSLVHLIEFKKRRVELVARSDRDAAEKLEPIRSSSGGGGWGPASSSREASEAPTGSGGKSKTKRNKVVKGKLSFAGEGDGDGTDDGRYSSSADPTRSNSGDKSVEEDEVKKRKGNPKLWLPAPKVLTKKTLWRKAQERETLRREFLDLEEKIKKEEISIPFVFYEGRYCACCNFLKLTYG